MNGYQCFNCMKAIEYDTYAEEWFHVQTEDRECNSDDSPNTVAEEVNP